MDATTPLLQVGGVSKAFPGVQALDGVSLTLRAAEVVAVVGENGAGKSTLMKILGGIYRPDAGSIRLDGRPLALGGVGDAVRQGISLIHQELNLAENLSVAANVFLGRELAAFGLLRGREMRREAARLIDRVGLDCPPETIVGRLSPGKKQLVEVARALSMRVRILIMDEPTSSLTQKETDRLYQVIDELKASGVSVLYISHRLAEVERVADRVVVLRDGRNAGELTRRPAVDRSDGGHSTDPGRTDRIRAGSPPRDRPAVQHITHEAMVRLMVGRELNQFFQRQHRAPPDDVRLELRRVRYAGVPGTPDGLSAPIDLSIHAGEILGMAGLVGSGRTELAEAVFGLGRVLGGEVRLDGRPVAFATPRQAIGAGVLLVPEDRRYHGLVLGDSVQHNIGLPNLDQLHRLGFVRHGREHALAEQTRDRLRIRTPNAAQPVGLLSGGNQQKVVLGKWLARRPRVLIVDEPTRGVDVGAKSEIYAILDALAAEGVAVWMISSDLEEILGMSDRVAVLHQGRVAGVLTRDKLSEESVMHLATGGGGK